MPPPPPSPAGLASSRRPGIEAKAIGALGLLAGPGVAALLAMGAIRMDVAGASLAYAAFAGWSVLVGLHLIRGGLEPDLPA